jgi:hypothetical protein
MRPSPSVKGLPASTRTSTARPNASLRDGTGDLDYGADIDRNVVFHGRSLTPAQICPAPHSRCIVRHAQRVVPTPGQGSSPEKAVLRRSGAQGKPRSAGCVEPGPQSEAPKKESGGRGNYLDLNTFGSLGSFARSYSRSVKPSGLLTCAPTANTP